MRKLHYRTEFQGLPISIENRKGSKRYWYDPMKDEHGETKMKHPYGYIRLTEGSDGDHVDCYIGPNKDSQKVFVVHQNNPRTGKYDEDKVMLGFETANAAKNAYLQHYNDPKFFGSIDEFTMDTFKDRVHRKKGKIKKSQEGRGMKLYKTKVHSPSEIYLEKRQLTGHSREDTDMESTQFYSPTELAKAKYTKRWKGSDGKWKYQYGEPKGRQKKADDQGSDQKKGDDQDSRANSFTKYLERNAKPNPLAADQKFLADRSVGVISGPQKNAVLIEKDGKYVRTERSTAKVAKEFGWKVASTDPPKDLMTYSKSELEKLEGEEKKAAIQAIRDSVYMKSSDEKEMADEMFMKRNKGKSNQMSFNDAVLVKNAEGKMEVGFRWIPKEQKEAASFAGFEIDEDAEPADFVKRKWKNWGKSLSLTVSLDKAKYTKRWKGADGKWHYQYGNSGKPGSGTYAAKTSGAATSYQSKASDSRREALQDAPSSGKPSTSKFDKLSTGPKINYMGKRFTRKEFVEHVAKYNDALDIGAKNEIESRLMSGQKLMLKYLEHLMSDKKSGDTNLKMQGTKHNIQAQKEDDVYVIRGHLGKNPNNRKINIPVNTKKEATDIIAIYDKHGLNVEEAEDAVFDYMMAKKSTGEHRSLEKASHKLMMGV